VAGAEDPRVLVDAATRDDAAVYRISEGRALVATVDFFTPVVDDAATWGRIAAANALSDLFAMGATPLFALNLVGWPREKLPLELLGEVLTGAAEVARLARCPVVGGHTVDALEPHFGLVAIGEADPERLLTNATAHPGDRLVLTKPLGTGILTTALKRSWLTEAELGDAIASMTALNDGAMRVALEFGLTAATDVTGFGLLGHLGNILAASGVGARLAFDDLPFFRGVRPMAERDAIPGGTRRNLEAASGTRWDPGITAVERLMAADAQTSGGLLLAVPADRVAAVVSALRSEGTLAQAVIGEVTAEPAGTLTVQRTIL
jgi:selenide, water dikinase